MAFPTGNRDTSDLLLEETGPREARVGQPYNYQVKVTNLTRFTLTGVMLEQRLPENFKVEQSGNTAPPPAENGRMERIQVGDLRPNESKTIDLAGVPTQQGSLDTCLSARYNPPTLCTAINVVAPALKIVAEGPSQADVCQELPYRYTITNTGTGTARNVVLQENLPEGLQTTDGQKTVSANVGDLTAGQSKQVTVRLRAGQAGKYSSRAIARSDAGEARTEEISTNVLAPRLAVTVSGPKQDYSGQQLPYQVTVKNTGDAPAANSRLRITATNGQAEFVSARSSQGGDLSRDRLQNGADLGTIAPGESRTIDATFTSRQEGALTLAATAEANCAQPVTTPVDTNVMAITAAALVVTHDPDPVRVGNNVVYHITVQNKGTAADRNFNVSATLPDSLQFVRASGATQARADGQKITFAPVDALQPKETAKWDVEAKAMRPDEAQFQTSMTSESTRTPATKIEPTKLYGTDQGNQQRTNQAEQPARKDSPAPPPPGGDNNK